MYATVKKQFRWYHIASRFGNEEVLAREHFLPKKQKTMEE
jgi:hypothetical protein